MVSCVSADAPAIAFSVVYHDGLLKNLWSAFPFFDCRYVPPEQAKVIASVQASVSGSSASSTSSTPEVQPLKTLHLNKTPSNQVSVQPLLTAWPLYFFFKKLCRHQTPFFSGFMYAKTMLADVRFRQNIHIKKLKRLWLGNTEDRPIHM